MRNLDLSLSSLASRRSFIARLSALAATAGFPASPLGAEVPAAPWDLSWLDSLKGKHRQVFALGELQNGVGLSVVTNWLDAHEEVFGLKPLAGRFFERARSGDGMTFAADALQPVVLNETAVRRLGFASPQAAIGRSLLWHGFWDEDMPVYGPDQPAPLKPSRIVGVVPDIDGDDGIGQGR